MPSMVMDPWLPLLSPEQAAQLQSTAPIDAATQQQQYQESQYHHHEDEPFPRDEEPPPKEDEEPKAKLSTATSLFKPSMLEDPWASLAR